MSIFAYHFCNVYYHMISQNTSIIINHYQLIDWVLSETCGRRNNILYAL